MFAFWPNKMISNQQEVLCHISALGTLLELVVRNLRPGLTFSFMTQKQISRHVLKNWKHFCLNRNSTVYLSSNADFLIMTDESFRLKRRQKKYNLKYGDLPFPGIRIAWKHFYFHERKREWETKSTRSKKACFSNFISDALPKGGYLVWRSVWPDWAIFERSWQQIILQKWPKDLFYFLDTLKNIISKVKTVVDIFWETFEKLGNFLF